MAVAVSRSKTTKVAKSEIRCERSLAIARYLPDGNRDADFDADGKVAGASIQLTGIEYGLAQLNPDYPVTSSRKFGTY